MSVDERGQIIRGSNTNISGENTSDIGELLGELLVDNNLRENLSETDIVLEMLEFELNTYLEQQEIYSYEVKICEDAIYVVMKCSDKARSFYPSLIQYKLFVESGRAKCLINDTENWYYPGILSGYVKKNLRNKFLLAIIKFLSKIRR